MVVRRVLRAALTRPRRLARLNVAGGERPPPPEDTMHAGARRAASGVPLIQTLALWVSFVCPGGGALMYNTHGTRYLAVTIQEHPCRHPFDLRFVLLQTMMQPIRIIESSLNAFCSQLVVLQAANLRMRESAVFWTRYVLVYGC